MSILPSHVVEAECSTGNCVKSKLGTWLAEAGGGFHPGLVFRNVLEDTSLGSRSMGMSIFTEQSINQNEVLASCSLSTIIGRKNSLETIKKLLQLHLSREKDSSIDHLFDYDDKSRNIIHALTSHWLDRTVISLYLILTRLSIRFKDLKPQETDGDIPSSPFKNDINELFSFHEPYVRLLPRPGDLMTPLFWNEPEIEKLRYTPLYHSVKEQKDLWMNEYRNLMKNILQVSPLLHDLISRYICCDDYFWASTIVTSRSFPSTLLATSCTIHQGRPKLEDNDKNLQNVTNSTSSDSQPILLPGVDIFNHRRGAKVEWRSIHVDSQFQRLELVTLEDQLSPGEQVFNNYGPKSTAELIMGYGFALCEEDWKKQSQPEPGVLVNNPDDFYTIKLSKPKTTEIFSPLISKIFDEFKDQDLIHHIRRDGLIPRVLLAQLGILVISTQEEIDQILRCYHPLDQITLDSLQFQQKLSWSNELNSLDCLTSLIKLKLEELEKFNKASDEKSQWDQIRSPVKKMIQIYTQGQRSILESALKHLDTTSNLTLSEAEKDGFVYEMDDDDSGSNH